MKFSQRNRGALALKQTGKTQEQIAKRVKASMASVAYWQSGERVPNAAARARLRDVFGIAPELWDKPIPRLKDPAPPAAPDDPVQTSAPPAGSIDVRSRALRMQGHVDRLLDRIEKDAAITSSEYGKVLSQTGSALKVLGTMTGETLGMSEARILRLPAMARIQEAFVATIQTWPETTKYCDLETAKKVAAEILQRLGETLTRMGATQ